MRIERSEGKFIICRGKRRPSYFCFFVDSDSSAWTSYAASRDIRIYTALTTAQDDLAELGRRARARKALHV